MQADAADNVGERQDGWFSAAILGAVVLSLAYFFFALQPAAIAALLLIVIALYFGVCQARDPFWLVTIVVVTVVLRWRFSDFSLVVGDASSYLWDAINAVETNGRGSGHFPPLAAAMAAVGYLFFDIKGAALPNVLLSALTGLAVYSFMQHSTRSGPAAIAAAIFVAVQPLSIWFSKTTFSEVSWQTIVALCLLLTSRDSVRPWQVRIGLLAAFLVVANFSRGTAPFLFAPILACMALDRSMTIQQRAAAIGLVVLLFTAALAVMFKLRFPYLIEWQYSQVHETIRPWQVLSIVGVGALLAAGFVLWLSSSGRQFLAERVSLAGFVLFKIGVAAVFPGDFVALLIGNEAGFAIANFGWFGLAVAAIGAVLLVRKAWHGHLWALAVVGIYCFAAAPFALQDVSVARPHEMELYWSRYFYSEFALLYAIAIVFAASTLFRRIALRGRLLGCAYAMTVALTISWPLFNYTVANAYLAGSADLVSYIAEATAGKKSVLVASDKAIYSGYGSGFLLSRIPQLEPNVTVVRVADGQEIPALPRAQVLICVNIDCASFGVRRIGEISIPVAWDRQLESHERPSSKSAMFHVSVHEVDQLLATTSIGIGRVPTKHETAGVDYLASGWSTPESWGTWSIGRQQSLEFDVGKLPADAAFDLVLAGRAYVTALHRQQRIRVSINGELVSEAIVEHPQTAVSIDIRLKPEWLQGGKLRVDLATPDAVSPKALGESADGRELAIGLETIELRKASKPN